MEASHIVCAVSELLLLAEYNLRYVVKMESTSFCHMHCAPEEEPLFLGMWDWHPSEPWPPRPGFNCPSWMLLFTDCSVANKLHMSLRKIYGKGKGGDAGEYVYITAESRTEPLVFQRGCCRSLKCAIGKEFLKEHLFSDESPYLGLHRYFLTINSATDLTSMGGLRVCSSQCRMSHYETSSHECKDCFRTGCIQFLILLTVPQFSS